MWLDGIGFATPLEDPTKSRIVGKVGYGVMPPGPEGAARRHVRRRHGHFARLDQKKEAAWLYLQWATNKANQLAMLKAGAGAPGAQLAYHDTETHPRTRRSASSGSTAMLGSAKIGRPGLPEIVPVTEFRDIFGVALTNMIGGADPTAELEEGDRSSSRRCWTRASRADGIGVMAGHAPTMTAPLGRSRRMLAHRRA